MSSDTDLSNYYEGNTFNQNDIKIDALDSDGNILQSFSNAGLRIHTSCINAAKATTSAGPGMEAGDNEMMASIHVGDSTTPKTYTTIFHINVKKKNSLMYRL